jgi:hypothetical protein
MDPKELAAGGIDRHGGAARSGREVQPAVDHQRAGLQVEVGTRAEVVGLEPPGNFQFAEIGGVDLIERRVARGAGIAGPRAPFSILCAGLSGEGRDAREEHEQNARRRSSFGTNGERSGVRRANVERHGGLRRT